MKKKIKDFIRFLTPQFILNKTRAHKKKQRNQELQVQKEHKNVLTKSTIIEQLKAIGIEKGDTLLVHSSLSKIGYVEGGPTAIIEALIDSVGEDGHILMPSSPNNKLQLDYIKELKEFDVLNSKSALGAITECFRTYPDVKRSLHPTEPVSCWGKDKEFFIGNHFGQLTPYNENSPFYKVASMGGKILMIGVTLDNAGTNLHCLEDAVNFKFSVYHNTIFDVKMIDESGNKRMMKTKVHNPIWSKKRKCDELIPMFEEKGVLKKVKIGEASTLLIDAKKMLSVMIQEYESNGITMYTPKGS
ncbi:MAG: AAC(3) family N-acetyltransferase [Crocinitomicaceae bacterium]